MPRRRWILVAVVALTAMTVTTAHAARLGGVNGLTSKKLYSVTGVSQDAMPPTLVRDAFEAGVDSLAGQASDSGQTWNVVAGLLSQSTNYLRCTACSGTNYGVGLIDAFRSNVTVTADLTPSAGSAGVVLDADPALQHVVVVWVSANNLVLSTYSNNTFSQRATAPITLPVSGVQGQLRVVALNGRYTATFRNASLTFTLLAGEAPAYTANTLTGVAILADNGGSRIDNFLVTK